MFNFLDICEISIKDFSFTNIIASNFRFVLVNAGLTYLYFNSFQQIDEEEYGGAWELTKEGFMTSFAGFLVSSNEINNN